MPVRTAEAEWKGTLNEGTGTLKSQTGSVKGQYSASSRFEEGTGTNPEELIAAAHAGCFSMALSGRLGRAGFTPDRVKTTAKVHLQKLEPGFTITKIELITRARVPGIDAAAFQEAAEGAKKGCPISRALNPSIEVVLDAKLE
jgi:osmotically inducible protein OsmC